MPRKRAFVGLFAVVLLAIASVAATQIAGAAPVSGGAGKEAATKTPIKHLVVIFQENVSFDHYFGTYPKATNTDGQPFTALPVTPAVDGLMPATSPSLPASLRHTADLTVSNPNGALPLRLDSSANGLAGGPGGQLTCDQDHNYSDEQQAFDGGLMDLFVASVGTASGNTPGGTPCVAKTVMDYYDGNTVTALWNYAQRNAMSDNSYGTTFGPSAPGAINLVSGDTGDVDTAHEANAPSVASSTAPDADITADGKGGYSLTSDAQPYWDDCSTRDAVALKGTNIGDLLNQAGLSWGWFQGGFRPTESFTAALTATGNTGQATSTFIPDEFKNAGFQNAVAHSSNQGLCDAVTPVGVALGGTGQYGYKDDYIPHHEPFQYYASTANPHHITIATSGGNDVLHGPDSLSTVGTDTQTFTGSYGVGPKFDTPNHNYDTSDFNQLVAAIASGQLPPSALPAVTFLKAPGYQDGHAAYSDPADEQQFVVKEIDALEQTPDWSTTAVIVNYDDSDGWYDHATSGITNPSLSGADNLTGTKAGKIGTANPTSGQCGPNPQTSAPLAGEQGRCGFGPRLPMLVVSPCAKTDYVDHNLSDQSSIINFVEYNWNLPSIPGSFDQALAGTDKAEGIPFDLAGMFNFARCSSGSQQEHAARDQGNGNGNGNDDGGRSGVGPNPAVQLDPATGQVNLAGADLSGQKLQGADLSGAILTNANLKNAHLQGAFLPNANLTGANLENARLQNADLAGANLTGANTKNVTWSNTTCPDGSNSDNDLGGHC